VSWASINFTGSDIKDIVARSHQDLQNLQGGTAGQYYHLTAAQFTSVGTVTSVSVVSANGFAGTVATATTTPAITVKTSITGLLKGNGTAISAATAGTDYLAPFSSQTANYVYAAPNGTAGLPTFRALVAADIPTSSLFAYGSFQDTAYTTLSSGINNSVTTVPVVSTTGFPTSGQIYIEGEIVSYTGVTSVSFTGCTRAAFGTTAASHSSGAFVAKTQAVAANTAAVMYQNLTDISSGISLVSSSQITVSTAGVYNLQWSGQFINSDTSAADVSVWIRINGTDVTGSNGIISVPSSHGGIDGHVIAAWNYFVSLTAGQYLELWWCTDNQKVTLQCVPPQTSPTRPATASLITSLNRIA
jgi:hypothetical protein